METKKMDRVTAPVSRMIYGAAIRPLCDGTGADDILDAVFAAGITTFDTARSYGLSERELGKWVAKRGLRDKLNILTKGCNPHQTGLQFTPESLRGELEESLRQLDTPYADFYALHRDDETQDVGVFVDTLNEFVSEGKIRLFGASNWTWKRMDAANRYAANHGLMGFSFGSPAFSLAEVVRDPWGGSIHLSGADNRDARAWFRDNGIPVFAYSSFARGFFSGKFRTDQNPEDCLPWGTCQEYVCPENLERLRRAERLADEKNLTVGQINLAWILAQDFDCHPIFSPSTRPHLEENLRGLNVTLTPQEQKWLNLEADI